MKKLIATTAALALTAGAAMADGPICEREITLYQDGALVDTSTLTFYAHGCDRFQYQPLTEAQVRSIGEHCSVESTASGGTEEETVVEEVDYGVADGSQHDRDNLTSMGASSTTGEQVMRVRSATDGNPVTIRRHGSGVVWTGTVDAGDTFVQVGPSGTYIAQTGSRRITKATGPQTFVDRTETTAVVERDEAEFYQPGPRTDRCGYFGEVVQ